MFSWLLDLKTEFKKKRKNRLGFSLLQQRKVHLGICRKTLSAFVNSSYCALHSYHQLCAISSNIFSCLMYHFDSQCPCVKTWFLFSDVNLALKRSKTHKHHTSEHRTNARACNVIPVWIAMETYQNVAECLGALCVCVCVSCNIDR